VTETRYLVPPGADWAVWDDANGVLTFMRHLGDEFARSPLPPDPTPEQAWAYVNALWEGDPGGRGWQVRVPAGATWLSLRDDGDDTARGAGRSRRSGSARRPWAKVFGTSAGTDEGYTHAPLEPAPKPGRLSGRRAFGIATATRPVGTSARCGS
jgi:hypothetical protein